MPEVMFNGPEGRIEGRYTQSKTKGAPVALILHPHPVHGGTMNNKVVYNIFHSFVRNDFSVLRMNFRGVGRSQGKFDNGIGELADAATAMDWLQLQNPDTNAFWVAGFSFGAWISMQLLMRRPEIQGFIAASPPVNKYDFGFLSPCPSAGLIVQGNKDSVVSEADVAEFANRLMKQKNSDVDFDVIEGADHFYRDKIAELNDSIENYIKDKLLNAKPKKVKLDRRRRQAVAEPLQ